jgi:hypothetical protein
MTKSTISAVRSTILPGCLFVSDRSFGSCCPCACFHPVSPCVCHAMSSAAAFPMSQAGEVPGKTGPLQCKVQSTKDICKSQVLRTIRHEQGPMVAIGRPTTDESGHALGPSILQEVWSMVACLSNPSAQCCAAKQTVKARR